MFKVDLNCDLGESFGNYRIGDDENVIPLISSANIACGFHASDPIVMQRTVNAAAASSVGIGAHPGYPDLMGFGRRFMKLSAEEAEAYVMYQIGALSSFAAAAGKCIQHVKPHGALYNAAAKDSVLADAICRAIKKASPESILLALSGSEMVEAAHRNGLRVACEVFADRAYNDDGTLVARSEPGSVITDENEAVSRAVRMVREGIVVSRSGKKVAVQADSICVHGDGAKALAFVKKIRSVFESMQICICPLCEIIE